MNLAYLGDLIGQEDPLDPAKMRFMAKPGTTCRGCLFAGQRASVCHLAASVAMRADLPDCDSGVVYIATPIDERQLTIE